MPLAFLSTGVYVAQGHIRPDVWFAENLVTVLTNSTNLLKQSFKQAFGWLNMKFAQMGVGVAFTEALQQVLFYI